MDINFDRKYVSKGVSDELLSRFEGEFKFVKGRSFSNEFKDVPERFFRLADILSEVFRFSLYLDKDNNLCYKVQRPPYTCASLSWSELTSFCDELVAFKFSDEVVKRWCGPGKQRIVISGKVSELIFGVLKSCSFERKCVCKFCFNSLCAVLLLFKAFGWRDRVVEERKFYSDNFVVGLCNHFYRYRMTAKRFNLKGYFDKYHLSVDKIFELLKFIDSGKCWVTGKWEISYPLDYKLSDCNLGEFDTVSNNWNCELCVKNGVLDLNVCQYNGCDKCGTCDAKLVFFVELLIQSGLLSDYIEVQKEWERTIYKKCDVSDDVKRFLDSAKNNNMLYAVIRGEECSRLSDMVELFKESAVLIKDNMSPDVACMSMLDCAVSLEGPKYGFGKEKFGEYCSLYDLPNDRLIILNRIGEFVDVYNDTKDTILKYSVFNHFIKLLSDMDEDKFIILIGTCRELSNFFALSSDLKDAFSDHVIDIPDLTSDELFDIFRKHVKRELGSGFKNEFIEYLAVSKSRFPFNNEDLAIFLANSYNDENKLPERYATSNTSRDELNKMIGLEHLKEKMEEFREFNLSEAILKQKGIEIQGANNHMVFYGNPGTGKTTAARIVAKMLYEIGVLEKDTVVEASRKDFIAKFLGQTAHITQATIDKAMGGVLFIDEAYSLCRKDAWGTDSYGQEAVATLIKAMEDHKDNLVVIFAGYKKEMDEFMDSNSGLKSRIGYSFDFPDYSAEELNEILVRKLSDMKFAITDGALKLTLNIFNHFRGEQNFGNGRFVDSLIQAILIKQTKRDTQKLEIIEEDIPRVIDLAQDMYSANKIFTFNDASEYDCKVHLAKEIAESVSSYIFTNKVLIEEINLEDADGNTTMYAQDVFDFYKNTYWSGKALDSVIITLLIGREAANLIYDDEVFEPINDTVIELITLKICNNKYIDVNKVNWRDMEDVNNEFIKYKEKAHKLAKLNKDVIVSIIEKVKEEKHLNRDKFEEILAGSDLKTLNDAQTTIGFNAKE